MTARSHSSLQASKYWKGELAKNIYNLVFVVRTEWPLWVCPVISVAASLSTENVYVEENVNIRRENSEDIGVYYTDSLILRDLWLSKEWSWLSQPTFTWTVFKGSQRFHMFINNFINVDAKAGVTARTWIRSNWWNLRVTLRIDLISWNNIRSHSGWCPAGEGDFLPARLLWAVVDGPSWVLVWAWT